MSVTLSHSSGSVLLPSPALNQNITHTPNQSILRTPAGTIHTFRHGPARWNISRTFEFLSEKEIKNFWDWFEAIGRIGIQFVYLYKDARDGTNRTPFARIMSPPREVKLSLNLRNLSIVFEHLGHPDAETDRSVQV